VEQRGLAGPVRAHDADDPAGRDLKGDPLQGLDAAERHRQPIDREQRPGHGMASPVRGSQLRSLLRAAPNAWMMPPGHHRISTITSTPKMIGWKCGTLVESAS